MSATLRDSLQLARDRLLAIARLAVADSAGEFAYIGDQGATYPYFEVVFPSVQRQRLSPETQRMTVSAQVILWCGGVTEDYDGELQDRIFFEWLPDMVQAFDEYANLKTPDNMTAIPMYEPNTSGPTGARVGVTGQSSNRQVFTITLDFTLVFQTWFRRKC